MKVKILIEENNNTMRWLVRRSAEEQLYIVVPDSQTRVDVQKMAKEMNYYIPTPVTLSELLRGKLKDEHIKKVLAVDIDKMIQYLIKIPFKGFDVDSASARCINLINLLR